MATVLTKGEIVLFALRKFAIASNASLTDVEPQSIEDGVNDLEDMMSEWMINPGDIGYAFATGDDCFARPFRYCGGVSAGKAGSAAERISAGIR